MDRMKPHTHFGPPVIFWVLISFVVTWIAEKLDVLPDHIRISSYLPIPPTVDYWIMLVILGLVCSIPLIKAVWRNEI